MKPIAPPYDDLLEWLGRSVRNAASLSAAAQNGRGAALGAALRNADRAQAQALRGSTRTDEEREVFSTVALAIARDARLRKSGAPEAITEQFFGPIRRSADPVLLRELTKRADELEELCAPLLGDVE